MMPACLLLVMLLGQSAGIGCVRMTDSVAISDLCDLAEPIRWSRLDSDETILQAKRLNARWKALCAPRLRPGGRNR